jgi:16S rRNA (adenine1518-N6/adenine1519-N6)-dimethyltransferase
MVRLVENRFQGRDLRIVHGDILRTDLATLGLSKDASYAVVANIPYNITSPILEKFLDSVPAKAGIEPGNDKMKTPLPRSMTLMVQKEVADRILAKRGDMNALAVFVRTRAHVERVMNVARGAFFPPPKVESSVIHIVHKSEKEMADFFGPIEPDRYAKVVRAAFQGKRKQLGNSLRAVLSDKDLLRKCLNAAKIEPSERPENLDIDDWKLLAEALQETH